MDLSEISANPHRHPWEMSRANFLMKVLYAHIHLTANSELLDVGAGDLFFSEKIHFATSVRIDAVDQAFDDEKSRIAAIQKIKYLSEVLHKKYDAICALDVFEHVEDDREFMGLLLNLMKAGSTFLLTAPAYQGLFSNHDRNLKHFRRYELSSLKKLIQEYKEIQVLEEFYFFHTLLYFRFFEKWFQIIFGKKQDTDFVQSISHWGFSENHPVSYVLMLILRADARICRSLSRFGILLPGLSLCLVLKKKAE